MPFPPSQAKEPRRASLSESRGCRKHYLGMLLSPGWTWEQESESQKCSCSQKRIKEYTTLGMITF